ncbi:MAG: hypothetical protein ABI858_11700, partial [Pseudoxanthomonas sp.]
AFVAAVSKTPKCASMRTIGFLGDAGSDPGLEPVVRYLFAGRMRGREGAKAPRRSGKSQMRFPFPRSQRVSRGRPAVAVSAKWGMTRLSPLCEVTMNRNIWVKPLGRGGWIWRPADFRLSIPRRLTASTKVTAKVPDARKQGIWDNGPLSQGDGHDPEDHPQ